jgi:hypothetical protein
LLFRKPQRFAPIDGNGHSLPPTLQQPGHQLQIAEVVLRHENTEGTKLASGFRIQSRLMY